MELKMFILVHKNAEICSFLIVYIIHELSEVPSYIHSVNFWGSVLFLKVLFFYAEASLNLYNKLFI